MTTTGVLSVSCAWCSAPVIIGPGELNYACPCGRITKRSDYQQPAVADRRENNGKQQAK